MQDVHESKATAQFAGKAVVVTGKFKECSRRDVQALLLASGCTLMGSVSRRTSVVIAGEDPSSTIRAAKALNIPVWPDDLSGFEGPLAGLATGLRRCATPLLVTAPCDSPFVPLDLVDRLYAALIAHGADLALAETEEADETGTVRIQPQPVFALVRTTALPHLASYLAEGGRRMDGWYGAIKVVRVRFDDASAFRNINTLRELQQYESEPDQ